MLYHVIASTSSIEYRLDPTITSNVLYFQHEDLFILLWQTRMKEKYLKDYRHARWFEGNVAFLTLLFLSCFFVLRLFGYYTTNKNLDLLTSDTVIKQTREVNMDSRCDIVFHAVHSVYRQHDARVSATEQCSKTSLSKGHRGCGRSRRKVLEAMRSVWFNKQPIM